MSVILTKSVNLYRMSRGLGWIDSLFQTIVKSNPVQLPPFLASSEEAVSLCSWTYVRVQEHLLQLWLTGRWCWSRSKFYKALFLGKLQFVHTTCFSRWWILLRLFLNRGKSNGHNVPRRQQLLILFQIPVSWVGFLLMKRLNFRLWLSRLGDGVNFCVFFHRKRNAGKDYVLSGVCPRGLLDWKNNSVGLANELL